MSRFDMSLTSFVQHCDMAELSALRSARWRPGGLGKGQGQEQGLACHSEIFSSSREASGAGSALALALDDLRHCPKAGNAETEDRHVVLWVQTREAARLSGLPYRAGLPEELRHRVIHVLAGKPEDALFAMEEAVRCRDVAFVLGELTGNPRALDFTASRRLTLTAERHGVPLYLVRLDAARDLSSARMRWEVSSAISAPPAWNMDAPGAPAWHAQLFRARSHAPGEWVLRQDNDGRLSSDSPDLLASPPLRADIAAN